MKQLSVDAVAWPNRLRSVPWAVWALLALAGFHLGWQFLQPSFGPVGAVTFVAPIVFAAAVIYAAPRDRRFTWAALALAAPAVAVLIARALPELWFAYAPGDWKNATPMLIDAGTVAQDLARLLELVGLGLFGLALGGVRSFVSFLILGLGLLLALGNATWTLSQQIELMPLFDLAQGLTYATLHVLLLAFVFAAAVESLRTITLVGAGLLFATAAANAVLLWWTLGPDSNFALLSLIVGGPAAAGWIALIAAPLRGEFDASDAASRRVRSRAGRGSSVPRRAG